MREVSAGIIGFGFMGRMHTFGYRNLTMYNTPAPLKVKSLAVAEATDAGLAAAKDSGFYDKVTQDWRELIDDKSIDIIHVCTPNVFHAEMLKAAIEADKYIYCDKPITATYDEAVDVGETIKRTGYSKTNQMALNYRFYPSTQRAKQLVDEGFLGDAMSFRGWDLHNSNVDPNRVLNWKANKAVGGGGVLVDLGSHILDLLTFLLGPPKRIFCKTEIFTHERPDGKGGTVKVEAEDLALMVVEMACGAVGTIEASKVALGANDDVSFTIHGRQGTMKFDSMDANWLNVYDGRDSDQPFGGNKGFKAIESVRRHAPPAGKFPGPKFPIGWLEAHAFSLYNFLQAVSEDRPASPSLVDGIELERWMHRAYESAKTGQWVEI